MSTAAKTLWSKSRFLTTFALPGHHHSLGVVRVYIFAAAVAAALSAAAAFTPHMAGKGETEVCTARRNIGWAQIGVLFATFVTGERLAFWRAEARALEAENDRLRRQLANCRSDLDWPDPDAHAQMLQEAAGTDERSGPDADRDGSGETLIGHLVPSTGFCMGLVVGALVAVHSYSTRDRRGRSLG